MKVTITTTAPFTLALKGATRLELAQIANALCEADDGSETCFPFNCSGPLWDALDSIGVWDDIVEGLHAEDPDGVLTFED